MRQPTAVYDLVQTHEILLLCYENYYLTLAKN